MQIRRYNDIKTVNQSEYKIRKTLQQILFDIRKRKSNAVYPQTLRIRYINNVYRKRLKRGHFRPKRKQLHYLVHIFKTVRKRQLIESIQRSHRNDTSETPHYNKKLQHLLSNMKCDKSYVDKNR